MKRDMDLIRRILLEIEGDHVDKYGKLSVTGYDAERVAYHIRLLTEAGFVHAIDATHL